ncbi:MAG: hypothetical protein KGL55_03695 [Rhodospirillales bacterium]|nr:hypothetical protein [Rhodospirillales bacterium]
MLNHSFAVLAALRPPAVVPVLQFEADLAAGADPAAARAVLAAWLGGKTGADLRHLGETPNDVDLRPAHALEVVWDGPRAILAAQFTEADAEEPGRSWSTEVALFAAGGSTRLAVRLICATAGAPQELVPAVPRFVRDLAAEVGLTADGLRLATTPRRVEAGAGDGLAQLIAAPGRALPVLAVAEGADGTADLLAGQLAPRLVGLAHVCLLDAATCWALTERFGKPWSVFAGAARLYLPGFAPRTQSPYEHTLILGRDIAAPGGAGRAVARFAGIVARRSLEGDAQQERLPPFAAIRADILRARADRRIAASTAPVERATALDEKIRVLEEQVGAALGLAAAEEEHARQAREEAGEARREIYLLRQRIRALERRGGPGFHEAPPRPLGYEGLARWIEDSFPGRLALSAKARRAAMPFADFSLVCDAIEALAIEYVDMRRGGGRQDFERRLAALHVSDEAIAASPDRHRGREQYWCRHDGRDIFTDRHIKRGNSRDGRETLRIYYGWDEEAEMVVIGHLTTHLDTEIS